MKTSLLLIIFILALYPAVSSQDGEAQVRETVTVLNVEVPVRVFYKGEPVDNLTKQDFSLIVNGKEREIIGFNIIRKQLEVQEVELEKEREFTPRYFVLAANITNFSPDIKKGVDQIIDRVIRKEDSMLVFINNKSIMIRNFQDREGARAQISALITAESIQARERMQLYFQQIENEIDLVRFGLTLKQTGGGEKTPMDLKQDIYFISDFLRKYLVIWKDYKNRYLLPDVKTYLLFSKHLQDVPVEKWVISLYQQELFPEIVMSGEIMRSIQSLIYKWQASTDAETVTYSRMVSKQLNEIRKELNISDGFPTEEITKIFTKVGATFHSVFMSTTIQTFSKDMEYKKISSDLENNLRGLTKKTGGELVSTTDLKIALDQIVKKQDIFYILTYAPREGEKLEQLKIKIHKKKHDAVYDDNVRTEFTSKPARGIIVDSNAEIKIKELNFKEKKLSFLISEFAVQKTGEAVRGSVNVRIRINNMQDNPVFDKSNEFTTGNMDTSISLDFKWLTKGRYEIIVDAKDNLTGKTATDYVQVKVD